jgi:hypothetical protein
MNPVMQDEDETDDIAPSLEHALTFITSIPIRHRLASAIHRRERSNSFGHRLDCGQNKIRETCR